MLKAEAVLGAKVTKLFVDLNGRKRKRLGRRSFSVDDANHTNWFQLNTRICVLVLRSSPFYLSLILSVYEEATFLKIFKLRFRDFHIFTAMQSHKAPNAKK